jgi:hypothetical protein
MSSQVKSAIETAGLPTDNLLIKRTSLPDARQVLPRAPTRVKPHSLSTQEQQP